MKSARPHERFLLSAAAAEASRPCPAPQLPRRAAAQRVAAAALRVLAGTAILAAVVLGFTSRADSASLAASTAEAAEAAAAVQSRMASAPPAAPRPIGRQGSQAGNSWLPLRAEP